MIPTSRLPPTPFSPQGLLRDHNGHLSDGRRMAAGFAAGITEALLIVTPFEVVKIRLQQQKGLAYSQLKYHVSQGGTRVLQGQRGIIVSQLEVQCCADQPRQQQL